MSVANNGSGPLALSVECFPDYASGLPMLVAVEVRNTSSNQTYLNFREFDLFSGPGPVTYTLRGGMREWTWPARPPRQENPPGIPFAPGQAWRALYDLSELHVGIAPGDYQLTASIEVGGDRANADPVPLKIHAAVPKDVEIAWRLRGAGDDRSWRSFVRDSWSTPEIGGLSEEAHSRLAYYLYLHRVAYGPRPLADLDPDEPRGFGQGPLESEAEVLQVEILQAAQQSNAEAEEAAVVQRWPGVAWRMERIHRGLGLLTLLRTFYGIENPEARKEGARPYAPR